MTQYRRGVKAEYRARDQLLADGYHTVLRMAGSHGIVDLVAVGRNNVLFVQVKSTVKCHLSFRAEVDALAAWEVPDNCHKQLWIWMRNKRSWMILDA